MSAAESAVPTAPAGGGQGLAAFCSTFSRSQDRFDLSALSAGLGEAWETTRMALKSYVCGDGDHTRRRSIST